MGNQFFSNGCKLLLRILAAIVTCALLTSCVSSKLDTIDPEPVSPTSQLSLSEEEQRSERLRNAAIAEIHNKADEAPYNEEAPAYGVQRQGETSLLTPDEIVEKINRIKTASGQLPATAKEQDIQIKQRKMNALRRKGSSHYNSALKNIESD